MLREFQFPVPLNETDKLFLYYLWYHEAIKKAIAEGEKKKIKLAMGRKRLSFPAGLGIMGHNENEGENEVAK